MRRQCIDVQRRRSIDLRRVGRVARGGIEHGVRSVRRRERKAGELNVRAQERRGGRRRRR